MAKELNARQVQILRTLAKDPNKFVWIGLTAASTNYFVVLQNDQCANGMARRKEPLVIKNKYAPPTHREYKITPAGLQALADYNAAQLVTLAWNITAADAALMDKAWWETHIVKTSLGVWVNGVESAFTSSSDQLYFLNEADGGVTMARHDDLFYVRVRPDIEDRPDFMDEDALAASERVPMIIREARASVALDGDTQSDPLEDARARIAELEAQLADATARAAKAEADATAMRQTYVGIAKWYMDAKFHRCPLCNQARGEAHDDDCLMLDILYVLGKDQSSLSSGYSSGCIGNSGRTTKRPKRGDCT